MIEDEEATAALLRLVGPRPEVAADRSARVRRAVKLEWQAGARRRAVRRRIVGATAVIAAATTIALVVRDTMPREDAAMRLGETVATVERMEGVLRLSPLDPVRTGNWVDTGAASRVALRLTNGTSLRLDIRTRARLISATVIELAAGALYLDTGRESTGLEVRTPLGTARDVGTQFEVRVGEAALRIRVRTGLVELQRSGRAVHARAGTQLDVTDGGIVNGPVPTSGPEWDWTASLAPAFEIEGRALSAFLEHLSREHAWTLRYGDPLLARDASSIILHGSVSGLPPREALAVALTTSGLAHRFEDGELLVFRGESAR